MAALRAAVAADPPTPNHARTLLDVANGHRLGPVISVATVLGLRLGEAVGVRWSDVDFEAGTRFVSRSRPGGADISVSRSDDFQDLVAGLLRGMGYHVAWISPPGADRGIDIIAHSDPLGITGPRIKVQVKRRPNERTGVDGVRSFMAPLADGDVGLFVSSGGFSKEAEDEAQRQKKRRITLVDLKRLFDLWVEHYAQIPEPQRRLLPLRPVYFLADDK